MRKPRRWFVCPSGFLDSYPDLVFLLVAKKIIKTRKHSPEFEITWFDAEKELYRDFLSARSQDEASTLALEYAKNSIPDCNRIHIDPVKAGGSS